ncbi:MAG: WG repeat-containing protein, partial [Fimbriiglobus sp.]
MPNKGLIDLLGREVLPCEYDYLVAPTCGLMQCRRKAGEKFGFIDLTGKFVIPPKYDDPSQFDTASGLANIRNVRDAEDYYGMIDTTGRYVVEPVYKQVDYPAEGMMRFQSHDGDQLFGFLDRNGKVAIPARFRRATSFLYGLAGVVDPGDFETCYFIDHSGNKVLGPYPSYGGDAVDFHPPGLAFIDDPATHCW